MIKFINKIKNSEIGMKLKEKIYPKYPEIQFKQAMDRFNVCQNRKKKSQIRREIHLYKKFWKCYPYDYFLSDLYRADNQITEQEIINYIPGFFWYKLFLPHFTSDKFASIIDNKIITDQMFRSIKISQPETFGFLFNKKLYTSEMILSSSEQIFNKIDKTDPKKIFVKPAEGSGGAGFFIFNKTSSGNYSNRENIFFNENFLSKIGGMSDFIIQGGIAQDPEFSDIHPDSVNTCRIVTENKNGNSKVVCAMMRFGRNLLEVDNVSSGGLCIKIDIQNGKVGEYALSYENEKFFEHPDSHFIFKNFKISRWNEIQRFVNKSAEKLPFFAYLGWDITLTTEGPVAIEANQGVGIEALQIANGGLRAPFGIDYPDYYWKNVGKRM
jgi:hypothetical protein